MKNVMAKERECQSPPGITNEMQQGINNHQQNDSQQMEKTSQHEVDNEEPAGELSKPISHSNAKIETFNAMENENVLSYSTYDIFLTKIYTLGLANNGVTYLFFPYSKFPNLSKIKRCHYPIPYTYYSWLNAIVTIVKMESSRLIYLFILL